MQPTFTPLSWGDYLKTHHSTKMGMPDNLSGLCTFFEHSSYGNRDEEVLTNFGGRSKQMTGHPFGRPAAKHEDRSHRHLLFQGATDMCVDFIRAQITYFHDCLRAYGRKPSALPELVFQVFQFPADEDRQSQHDIYYSISFARETLIVGNVTDYSGAGGTARFEIDSMLVLVKEATGMDIECFNASIPASTILHPLLFPAHA